MILAGDREGQGPSQPSARGVGELYGAKDGLFKGLIKCGVGGGKADRKKGWGNFSNNGGQGKKEGEGV